MNSGSARDYIELIDSQDNVLRFKVVQGGYKPVKEKQEDINRTPGGGLDYSVGAVYEQHQYTLKVYHEVADEDYGNILDLIELYELNDPAGTPSNLLRMHDHWNDEHYVYFVGQFSWDAVTTIISGEYAMFFVPCTFQFLP